MERVIERLKELIPNSSVEELEITKNNNVKMKGVRILVEGENMGPVIYGAREMLEEGADVESVVLYLHSQYQQMKDFLKNQKEILNDILDFEKAKPNLSIRLINKKNNEELLKNLPNMDFLDLSMVIQYSTHGGVCLIKNEIMKKWNVDKETLFDYLKSKMSIANYGLTKIDSYLKTICPDFVLEEIEENFFIRNAYVMTTEDRYYGASCMLIDDVFKRIATEFQKDVVVFPASVHEIIFMLRPDGKNISELNEIVTECNTAAVLQNEVLSDHIYIYTLNKGWWYPEKEEENDN